MDYIQYEALRRESELYHHGILGQKWGVRRYQNEDGSLTDAGRTRYYGNGSGTRHIQNQRERYLNKTDKRLGRIQSKIDSIENRKDAKRDARKAESDAEKIKNLEAKRDKAELSNEFRQKVLDVKASKTSGGRFVNYLFGGLGGNLAVSALELGGNDRTSAVGKEAVGGILSTIVGVGAPIFNVAIYQAQKNDYIRKNS